MGPGFWQWNQERVSTTASTEADGVSICKGRSELVGWSQVYPIWMNADTKWSNVAIHSEVMKRTEGGLST